MKKLILLCVILALIGGVSMTVMASEERLSLEKTSFTVGEEIPVTATGTGKDWIGIYYPGEPHSIRWMYVVDFGSGNSFDITKGIDNGDAPDVLPAGEYIVRLMPNDSTNIAEAIAETVIEIRNPDLGPAKTPERASYTLKDETSGYAAGEIAVTLAEGDGATDVFCVWADENGALAGLTPLAKFKVEDGEAHGTLSDYLLIPQGATRLLVYTVSSLGEPCEEPYEIVLPEGAASKDRGKPLFEFQVVSDTHIRTNPADIHNRHFTGMLRDVAKTSPDSIGIFVVGDMTDHGYAEEYAMMASLYAAEDGLPPLFLALGNHDLRNGAHNEKIDLFLQYATLPDGSHPESCHYDFWLSDHHFVFLGNDRMINDVETTLFRETTDWLDKTLAEDYEEGKPVFLFLHQSLYDTVAGSLEGQGWNGVANETVLRDVLEKYPDVIMFNGHSHWVLDSERTAYPRSAVLPTIFNTSSVAYLWTSYDVITGVEQEGSEGYYISVYEDAVYVSGRDFVNGKWVASAQFAVPFEKKAEVPPITEPPITDETPTPEPPITEPTDQPTDQPTDESKTGLWIALGALGALALGGAAVAAVILLKKKKK